MFEVSEIFVAAAQKVSIQHGAQTPGTGHKRTRFAR
jgi:hypothetical protein